MPDATVPGTSIALIVTTPSEDFWYVADLVAAIVHPLESIAVESPRII
ncbi:hypothetical protein [Lysinibacillus sp. NPDC086135]